MALVKCDAELLTAVAGGDLGALAELYARHAPWVRSRLRRRCADVDVAEEAVQDTFIAVWRSAGSWSGKGEPAAWIWGIAIRRLIGVLRNRNRWLPVLRSARCDELAVAAEEEVLGGIEHGDLAAAFSGLSPELRAVLQATVLDGLTTREASVLLGIPTGTVKTRAMRARAKLRGALTREEHGYDQLALTALRSGAIRANAAEP